MDLFKSLQKHVGPNTVRTRKIRPSPVRSGFDISAIPRKSNDYALALFDPSEMILHYDNRV